MSASIQATKTEDVDFSPSEQVIPDLMSQYNSSDFFQEELGEVEQSAVNVVMADVSINQEAKIDGVADDIARSKLVCSQATTEAFLVQLPADSVVKLVHTAVPSTPCCYQQLVSSEEAQLSIHQDRKSSPQVSRTVQLRMPLVHSLARNTSADNPYYVIYAKTRTQQFNDQKTTGSIEDMETLDRNYQANLSNTNLNFKDVKVDAVSQEQSGASYFYKLSPKEPWRYFGVHAYQANVRASTVVDWRVWDCELNSQLGQEKIKIIRNLVPEEVLRKLGQ
ncbi:hypothetical protein D5R81_04440 [Parashewanella spongiae]|uniref:Uncharacterized protein n=1 Tax=Parashewanella spongiae TaxID=342950 RepID=A0A3A6U041_9GAMM|nr:hypothetical protein [Parashewanella spongiae]MCL1077495.1 hypothetical protein [Parashewanella spongiae]RJY18648.1 hypothetical protein D5R81_04440 [Parashewanella spongiae]